MATTSGNGHSRHYDLPEPNPDLTAEQVVQIVLEALQHNDDPCVDCGIRTTFNFASPANRAETGPLPRFIEMVRNPLYIPLLNFDRVELDAATVEEGHAEQRIRVFDQVGNSASYVFMLSKQPGPAWKDCWMTDGVVRIE